MFASGFRLPMASAANYAGKLFVFVQAEGGWDPTSFCDPKTNTLGEPVINHWAEHDEIQQAGNVLFAPFAENKPFFEKYFGRMLVINGVDAQTNSHTVGITHNWSGRNSDGYPTMSALLAASFALDLPVAYLSFGGYSETGGVTRFTRMNHPQLLRNLARPEMTSWDSLCCPHWSRGDKYIAEKDLSTLEKFSRQRAEELTMVSRLTPMDVRNREYYRTAFANRSALEAFVAAIPPDEELEPVEIYEGESFIAHRSELRRQAQLAVLAFKVGVAVSADLWVRDFDTHDNHDAEHSWQLGNLTKSVDYLWDYAEEHGVADRLVVVIGSDFGRTNFYNSQNGKDHWPIGSLVIMEKNQPWTNRVVGETDDLHFAHRINPTTLDRDDVNGTIIYPKHVHKALRRYLGIENTLGSQRFPFNNTEDFAFFG